VETIMNRRRFVGTLTLSAAVVAMGGGTAGCSAETDLEKVLALLPTVGDIIDVVGEGIATLDPGIGTAIGAALTIIGKSFAQIQTIVSTYKSDMAGIPPTLLNELDAAISAVMTEMTAIEGDIPGLPTVVAAGINVGLAAFQSILGYLGAVIPAPVAAAMFPRSYNMAVTRGVRFGTLTVVPSAREFQKTFNSRIHAAGAGWKKYSVHVNWVRVGSIPIVP